MVAGAAFASTASPLSKRARVEVIEAGGARWSVDVPPAGMRIGRALDQDLVLHTSTVSKRHAELFWRGDDLFVRDLGSCNGTRRDGVALSEPVLLANGDELVLGGTVVLRVELSGGGFGAPVSELEGDRDMMSTGAVPLPSVRSAPSSGEQLLGVVTRLYQVASYEELAMQLTRAVGERLGASRAALVELEPGGERYRTLGLYKGSQIDRRPLRDASFVSQTVLREARLRGVAHFVEGAVEFSASIMRSGAYAAAAAMIRPRDGIERILYLDAVLGAPPITVEHARELAIVCTHAAGAFDALEARLAHAHEQNRFAQLRRYFSPDVVEHILAGRRDLMDQPRNVHAAVLFADLVGYTKLSERLKDDPARLLSVLNRWLDAGAEAVLHHQGTLDKFIGDCVMAVFGAPFPHAHPELQAVRCALEMRETIARVSFELGEPLQITVGVNAGDMLAGSVGSKRRLEYTVLGDTVNVGSRLQGQAVPGEILVGPSVAEAVRGHVQLEEAGTRTLKNHGPVVAYRVLA